MSSDIENRTKAALKQFDSNMSGIFDRASFYDQELYSQAAYPQLTRAQMCFKYTLFAANIVFLVSVRSLQALSYVMDDRESKG